MIDEKVKKTYDKVTRVPETKYWQTERQKMRRTTIAIKLGRKSCQTTNSFYCKI